MVIGNRYEVVRTFEGGMGTAQVCKDLESPDQFVVLKTFKEATQDQDFRATLIKEANTWIALHGHSYLAKCDDVMVLDGRLYLKMPFYSKGSLADLLEYGPLPFEQAFKLAIQILLGMQFICEKNNILHRDLKPDNILIGNNNDALITDLGLAKSFIQSDQGGSPGTPPYMAPELFTSGKSSVSADIWAWGLIFFEMLRGHQAYTGSSLEELASNIVYKPPTGWSRLKKSVPKPVFNLIAKALEKDPSKRFHSYAELINAFDNIVRTSFDDDKQRLWKRDERILIGDERTASIWCLEVRGEASSSIKMTEHTELSRAVKYRSTGNRSACLGSLRNILGDDQDWATNWVKLMSTRSQELNAIQTGPVLAVYLNLDELINAAELRLSAFLDGLYDKEQIPEAQLVAYRQAATTIMESGWQTPKLAELCGQLYLQLRDFELSEKCLEEAWCTGAGHVQITTAACIATLYGMSGQLDKLHDFATNEIEPRFADLEDARALETCARPYLFLKDVERTLYFLRRSLRIDMNNPWGIMQACVAAYKLGDIEQAQLWRKILINKAPDSPNISKIDHLFPRLAA